MVEERGHVGARACVWIRWGDFEERRRTPESEECDDGDGYIGSFDVRSR
tara:strand:+ start:7868 stop:8014 length:147 start_codon:yes stop_codon:yes gene_type:complete